MVWSLVLHPDSEGPALISSAALPPFSVWHSWHTMIEALAPHGADEAFRKGILPGTAGRRENFRDAHVLDTMAEQLAVDLVAIADALMRNGSRR